MLNGPTLMLQEMDNVTGKNVGGLYLDLFKVSAYYPRQVQKVTQTDSQVGGVITGPTKYEGSYIVCDGITYCTVFCVSDLADEMWRTKKEWDDLLRS